MKMVHSCIPQIYVGDSLAVGFGLNGENEFIDEFIYAKFIRIKYTSFIRNYFLEYK